MIALTTYYNPFKGERRRHNYQVFRENLGVPLVTVEWSPDARFDLGESDADVMIRISGGDLMWQKERMLNHGLSRIRADRLAGDVAILDADVVFADADWHLRVEDALDDCPIVQCHSWVDYLPELPPTVRSRCDLVSQAPESSVGSLAFALAQKGSLFTTDVATANAMAITRAVSPAGGPGMACAVRLAALPDFALYDANIVGGGDLVLAAAVTGRLQELFSVRHYAPRHQADVMAWAAHCLPGHPDQQRLGYADNRVMHLWHGTLEGRQYGERMKILGPRGYDPAVDIDRGLDALRFMPRATELKTVVEAYLRSRNDA
ncbi:hypothetical protein [Caenimonas sp. SL110]|uniref:hypothetical protein n=1 Tax=Caenimonas sp. SL110 TaxID=1450524 RepID=UPI000653491C|nr:hypothetical protein [Caenimonas sp. SL110]